MNEHGIEIDTPIVGREMKPCPFCGTKVLAVEGDEIRFICRDEECMMADFSTVGKAFDCVLFWWNGRKEDDDDV